MRVIRVCSGVFALLGATGLVAADAPPKPNHALIADGPAWLRDWTPPVYPADAHNEKIGGSVLVRIVVDETGRVAQARVLNAADPRLGDAALAAVKTWTFSPAIDDQKPVATCLDVPFAFDPTKSPPKKPGLLPPENQRPHPAPRTPADIKHAPLGDYPENLRARHLAGRVVFECEVAPDGHAVGLRVVGATHADFVLPALESSPHWEFKPAMQGDLPVRAELRGEVALDLPHTGREVVLAANGITALDGSVPTDQPMPDTTADPVWPYELLLKGEGGSASAEFTVQANGHIADVKVRDATAPEFGRALVAALETWQFEPALNRGRGVEVTLVKRAEFKPPADATDAPLARLVPLARANTLPGGSGLDEKLTPLYRVPPIYPAALRAGAKPAGQATIEFVIDRDGRARLPRIVSATHEEFGWAAATAVAQWVFRAPRRGGAPTEVKVQIPIQFSPPSD